MCTHFACFFKKCAQLSICRSTQLGCMHSIPMPYPSSIATWWGLAPYRGNGFCRPFLRQVWPFHLSCLWTHSCQWCLERCRAGCVGRAGQGSEFLSTPECETPSGHTGSRKWDEEACDIPDPAFISETQQWRRCGTWDMCVFTQSSA